MGSQTQKNIRYFNFAAVKLTTFQVAKLPLWNELNKAGGICIAKVGLKEDLHML
jgi:hypothetical protein